MERRYKCSERALHSDGLLESTGDGTANARGGGHGHSDDRAADAPPQALGSIGVAAKAVIGWILWILVYFSTGNLSPEHSEAIPGCAQRNMPWLTRPFDPGWVPGLLYFR